MSYDPHNYTPEEPVHKNFITLPKGEYPFSVVDVFDIKGSKAGNSMLPLTLEFTSPDGDPVTVDENLVFTEAAKWKIDSFLKCIGPVPLDKAINFTAGSFIAWMKRQTGRARLGIETFTHNGKELTKNKVEAFLYDKKDTPPKAAPKAAVPPPAEEDPDNIPF